MTEAASRPSPYFVAGGTLSPEATSYVERSADRELFDALLAGKFSYVLNTRQMGKSSLCVRTMKRVQEAGVRAAFIDLTKIGGKNVSAEQWYAGIAVEIGRALDIRPQILAFWKDNLHLGPVQRLFEALREVALKVAESPVAVFFDEIDATRSLGFSADEFFAAIRECYNRRAHEPEWNRLTFCLLGVAVPSELISSPTATPFNIGERIVLKDFTEQEAMRFAHGLPIATKEAEAIVRRIFYWTNGHPYLTQSLCASVAATKEDVDAIVKRDLLVSTARETNINLADVGNRSLHAGDLEEQPERFRADLLSLYDRVLRGKRVPDDDSNRVISSLKLSGLIRTEDGLLVVRNRIYRVVFDPVWIKGNMPGQEVRRQRRAFYVGALRTALVTGTAIAITGYLAWKYAGQVMITEILNNRLDYELYVADVNLMQDAWEQDPASLQDLLQRTSKSPSRGWEWNYWNRLAHLDDWQVNLDQWCSGVPSPDGKLVAAPLPSSVLILDAKDGRTLSTFPVRHGIGPFAAWSPDGRHLIGELTTEGTVLIEPDTGNVRTVSGAEALGAGWHPFDRDGSHYLTEMATTHGVQAQYRQWSDGKVIKTVLPPNGGYLVTMYGQLELWQDGSTILGAEKRGKTFAFSERTISDGHEVFEYRLPPDAPAGDALAGLRCDYTTQTFSICTNLGWVYRWKRHEPLPSWKLHVDDSTVYMQGFMKDGTQLVTSSIDGKIQVWSTATKKVLAFIPGSLLVSGFSEDGSRIYEARTSLRAIDPAKYEWPPLVSLGKGETVTSGVMLPSGELALQTNRELCIYNASGKLSKVLDLRNSVTSLSPGGYFISRGGKAEIHVDSGATAGVSLQLGQSLNQMAYSSSGPEVALFHSGQAVRLYDLASGKPADWQLPGDSPLDNVVLSTSGRLLAVSDRDGNAAIWDLATHSKHDLGRLDTYPVQDFQFSPSSQRLAVIVTRGVLIFDVNTGAQLATLRQAARSFTSVRFSPDGRRIVTTGSDREIHLWDSVTGRELLRIGGFRGQLLNAQFSLDGHEIYGFADDGTVRVFHGGP